MAKIKKISGREILNSRGVPTLEVTVETENSRGVFGVPAGKSKGEKEAVELRDGDKRFGGLGVKKAVSKIQDLINPELSGFDAEEQEKIDKKLLELDGTENKSHLGGNTMIGVSIAAAKAAAMDQKKQTYLYLKEKFGFKNSEKAPRLFSNIINGGKHSLSPLAFQEYLVIPQSASIGEDLLSMKIIFDETRKIIRKEFGDVSANAGGDEGGFVLNTDDVSIPLEILSEAVKNTGRNVKLGLDAAAGSFYENGKYEVGKEKFSPRELLEKYKKFSKKFDIFSIEDPFFEDEDLEYFSDLNKNIIVVGDDLTVTSEKLIKRAASSIGAVIIKPNQIGTLSETIEAAKTAQGSGLKVIVSHRSGETNDDFVADLAAAVNAFGLKAGAPNRGERLAKYNRIWEIFK
ncbi:MAG: phosphopyruvate hydratase [Patescibacteria group bacterium]|nr:phosphopyruvate hydratase [Patescibacteria group bacterium]